MRSFRAYMPFTDPLSSRTVVRLQVEQIKLGRELQHSKCFFEVHSIGEVECLSYWFCNSFDFVSSFINETHEVPFGFARVP